jgi:hypothetical protein
MTVANLAVVGIKQFDDYEHFERILLKYLAQLETDGTVIQELMTIQHAGVNEMVIAFCEKHHKQLRVLTVDWDRLGKAAYFETNGILIERATHVVGFWDRADSLVSDAIDRGLRLRRAVKFFKVNPSEKIYRKQKEIIREQTSVCQTVSE